MSPKRKTETPRDIVKKLLAEGWIDVGGKGDHRNFKEDGRRVTVDMGVREIPVGTLRSVYRQAGWEW